MTCRGVLHTPAWIIKREKKEYYLIRKMLKPTRYICPNEMNAQVQENRQSHRLRGFDYSAEAPYFITICTKNKRPYLGTISNGIVELSAIGKIVKEEMERTSMIREGVSLDTLIIMPNHLHFIIILGEPLISLKGICRSLVMGDIMPFRSPTKTIGAIVRGFKSACVRRINTHIEVNSTLNNNQPSEFGWQRNYYDRIIRDQEELAGIRNYIENNPYKWQGDEYYCYE